MKSNMLVFAVAKTMQASLASLPQLQLHNEAKSLPGQENWRDRAREFAREDSADVKLTQRQLGL